MGHLTTILKFTAPYLARYRGRFAAGVLLCVFFGVFNASFVGATKIIFQRLEPPNTAESLELPSTVQEHGLAGLKKTGERLIELWLPKRGQPMTPFQAAGGLLLIPLLMGIRGAAGYLSRYCMAWVSERITHDLRCEVLGKLQSLSLEFFHRSKTGDLMNRVQKDTFSIQACTGSGFSDLIKEPVTLVSVLTALLLVNAKLAVVGLIFFPLCAIPITVLGGKMRKAAKAAIDRTVGQSNLLLESLLGLRAVKAFGLEKQQFDKFKILSRQAVHHNMKMVQAREQVNPMIEVISGASVGCLILYVVWTDVRIDQLVGFLTGMMLFYDPVKKLSRLHVLIKETSVAVDRITQVLETESKVKEPENPVSLMSFSQEIVFKDLSFSYGEEDVLRHVNLTIPKGTKLGIAGESGSGKSTLIDLLFRFYDPTKGSILVDGVDLRELSTKELRSQLALVSQDVVLFDLSVAENVACGRDGASQQEVEAAVRAASAEEFVSGLPNQFDTLLGERGVRLSGGQRQRISIARAFVRDAPILVLDEATAALDSKAEKEIQQAIDVLSKERTVISVAHRLSTLAHCDQIIVLSKGKIVEKGTYEELLRLDGTFAHLAMKQGISGSFSTSMQEAKTLLPKGVK